MIDLKDRLLRDIRHADRYKHVLKYAFIRAVDSYYWFVVCNQMHSKKAEIWTRIWNKLSKEIFK